MIEKNVDRWDLICLPASFIRAKLRGCPIGRWLELCPFRKSFFSFFAVCLILALFLVQEVKENVFGKQQCNRRYGAKTARPAVESAGGGIAKEPSSRPRTFCFS